MKTERLPFTARQRRRVCDNEYGYRPRNMWGSGDLPGPYAEGDIIEVPDGAKALERMRGYGPGLYVVNYCPSIDEGDAWYIRLTDPLATAAKWAHNSDRLHVAWADRSSYPDLNWLEGCTLIATSDPDGLAERERMLADGWTMQSRGCCPTCGQTVP